MICFDPPHFTEFSVLNKYTGNKHNKVGQTNQPKSTPISELIGNRHIY